MFALLLALAVQTPSALGPDDVAARVSTTGVAVKLALPKYVSDPGTLASQKRRLADRALLQGRFGAEAGSVKLSAAFGEIHTSSEWRNQLLTGQLVGLGQFETGGVACTERVQELTPPYAEVGWHAFPVAGDTAFDLAIVTLRNGDVWPITRADFEHIVGGARFAIVRLGEWDAMPSSVLDRMHSGLTREGGGAKWLAEQSASAPDGWACALAAAELGVREKIDAATRLAWCDRVIADIGKIESPGKPERFAWLTAQSGRMLALRDAGKLDEALASLALLREKLEEHGPIAKSTISYDASTLHALRKEPEAAVAAMREAIAGNTDWRTAAKRDASFQLIARDKALLALLTEK